MADKKKQGSTGPKVGSTVSAKCTPEQYQGFQQKAVDIGSSMPVLVIAALDVFDPYEYLMQRVADLRRKNPELPGTEDV